MVKEIRSKLGISQEALARELNVSWKTISRYEGSAPPAGGALLKLIRFAEEQKLEEEAAKLRYAYVTEIGEVGLGLLRTAYLSYFRVLFVLADLSNIAARLNDPKLEEAVDSLYESVDVMQRAIAMVLPWKTAGELVDPETGELAEGLQVDDEFIDRTKSRETPQAS